MTNTIVSIVIPVYNNQNSISECIDSVLTQTYKNIEVILIDDGSTDKSGVICDKYADIDDRVLVVHQKNEGVSAARNKGVSCAKGRYIQFVDSDDKLKINMTEVLLNEISNNDICICGYDFIYNNHKKIVHLIKKPSKGIYSFNDFVINFGELFFSGFINSPCNKLYDLEIIKEFELCFDNKLNMGEDLIFNLNYFEKCSTIKVIDDSLYMYLNYRENSLSKKYNEAHFENHLFLFILINSFINRNIIGNNPKSLYIVRVFIERTKSILEQINHKDNKFNIREQFEYINRIVKNAEVSDNFNFFIKSKIRKYPIDYLIFYKFTIIILLFYKSKRIIKSILFLNFEKVFKSS